MTLDTFRDDERTVDAVVRNIGVIGEAARHVPRDVQESYPDVPWSQMSGMRNVVIHEYSAVSVPIVWQTVKRNLPPLIPMLEEILERER
jgi:uncharacterized protein with HEPN domain